MDYQHHPRSRFERRMHVQRERANRRSHTLAFPALKRQTVTWRATRRNVRRCYRHAVQRQDTFLAQ